MTLQTCTITLAGVSIDMAFDGYSYYVAVPTLEKALGERHNSTREKIVSQSLKALLGKEISLGKKRVGSSFVTFMLASDFTKYLGWLANQHHKIATDLVVATALEAIERRTDKALGTVKTEGTYENQTRAFFRELARTSFQPELCSWFEEGQHAVNYGAEVNRFKSALKLPLVPVDNYSTAHMQTWSRGISAYNALRMENYSHTRALKAVGNHIAARA